MLIIIITCLLKPVTLKTILSVACLMALAIYLCTPRNNKIVVANTSRHNLTDGYASISEEYIRDVIVGEFIITDPEGKEIPYTITANRLVVFPVTISAGSKLCYILKEGAPTVMLRIDRSYDVIGSKNDKAIAVTVI